MNEQAEIFELSFELDQSYLGLRIDLALLKFFSTSDQTKEIGFLSSASRNKISYWIQEGYILVEQKTFKPSLKLKSVSNISLKIPPPKENWLKADDSIVLNIVHEDEDVLVIDKQAGLVVHPGAGHEEGTLAHALIAHLGEEIKTVGHPLRPGIVHRLDKGTSGLMVIAKTEFAYHNLLEQFQPPRSIFRKYLAVTHREPKIKQHKIDLAIARAQNNKTKMAVDAQRGKESITFWETQDVYKYGVLLKLSLETGRTHQIRVHLQAVGAEIIGDPVYGRHLSNESSSLRAAVQKIKRQALHACELEFIHPRSKERVSFNSSLPEDIYNLIEALR